MSISAPPLADIWPYAKIGVPPELASLSVDVFFSDATRSSVRSAQWVHPVDPDAAPRSSYALRITRDGGQGVLARWNPATGNWLPVSNFAMPDTGKSDCSIVELKGVVLGGVADVNALSARLKALLASELSAIRAYRLVAKVVSILAIMILFLSIRAGVERHAVEPFALIFSLAVAAGLVAVSLRGRGRALSERGLAQIKEQFQFEYNASEHAPLSLANVSTILRDINGKLEEEAAVFGFLLLLCFVYFISPLVVIGVVVALFITILLTSEPGSLRLMSLSQDRSELQLEQAFLSFRAGDDELSPEALRIAKKQVLRDRMRRVGAMMGNIRPAQMRFRLSQDFGLALTLIIVFSAYAFPIAAGYQKTAPKLGDSLALVSLFSVAPVIVLLSISRSTFTVSQILKKRAALFLKPRS